MTADSPAVAPPAGAESFAARAGPAIDEALEATLSQLLGACPETVVGPIRSAVLAPGKRIRPLLLAAAYRAAGGRHPDVYRLACSVELVHTYSLIHDDLPCMDDDTLRRGQPTLHVRYGVAPATLAGAALMPLAVETIWRAGTGMGLAEAQLRRLVSELTSAAGGGGMVGGQLADLQAEGRRVTREELQAIHLGKTARLMAAAVVMGGVAAGADESLIGRYRCFGCDLGLAFQVVDDILDLTGNSRMMGKAGGRDRALGKATTPAVMGIDEARDLGRRLAARAQEALHGLQGVEPLREIAGLVVERER